MLATFFVPKFVGPGRIELPPYPPQGYGLPLSDGPKLQAYLIKNLSFKREIFYFFFPEALFVSVRRHLVQT